MKQRLTAREGASTAQKVALAIAILAPTALIALHGARGVSQVSVVICAACLLIVGVKVAAVIAGFLGRHAIDVGPQALAAIDEATLPIYSVLVPLYKEEAHVVRMLLEALGELDYPREKLDVIFLLEEDDLTTRAAFALCGAQVEALLARVEVVPPGFPRTKPRACNHGLALARGELLVIYDAEDRPEPDQLKKAVLAFHDAGPRTACLQAKLNYYNVGQNLLTRLFTLEYTAWFDIYLPGLHALGAPIPLGGTSNHLRVNVLRELDGWDAHNVTEDCDLGIRLARQGWATRILDSTTWEEACSRVRPWLAQRSRWVKGYLQTFLVHTRGLHRTIVDLGLRRTGLFAATVGGLVFTLVLTLPSVALFAAWLYTSARDPLWRPSPMSWWMSISLMTLIGYFLLVHMVGAWHRKRFELVAFALLLPLYWAFMSVGALRGLLQFVFRPFHWEKTPHGLLPRTVGEPVARPARAAASAVAPVPIPAVARAVTIPSHRQARFSRRHRLLNSGMAAVTALGMGALSYRLSRVEAVQAKDSITTVDQSWFGHTRVTIEARVAGGSMRKTAALASQLVAFVKVLDGDWYEARVPSYDRAGDGIRFSVPLDDATAWRPVGHDRVWGPTRLRRVRELGVRAFGKQGDRVPGVEVTRIQLAGNQEPAPVVYGLDPANGDRVDSYFVYEARFTTGRQWNNPFDPDDVSIEAVFQGPSGDAIRVPAFFSQDYARRAGGGREELDARGDFFWAVRFAASKPGLYLWYLEGHDRSGPLGRSSTQALRVLPSGRPGYVRVGANHRFMLEGGEPFYPIGINIRSPSDEGAANYDFALPDQNEGAARMEVYLDRMKRAGLSMGRVWLAPWFGALEWQREVIGFHGVGQYNLQNAWRLDRVLGKAQDLGIFIELVLFAHGPFQPAFTELWGRNIDSQWADNPYNSENGGPVTNASAYLREPAARRGARNYLRYMAARYGAYAALFGWTMWTEVDTVSNDIDRIAAWHEEMATELRGHDLGRHLISTEFRRLGYPKVWSLPDIDYVQTSAYDHSEDRPSLIRAFNSSGLVARFDDRIQRLAPLNKPMLLEEYGGGWWGGSMDMLAQNIHDGLWLGWVDGLPSTPLAWWWNLIFDKGLDRYYRVFADYSRGEEAGGVGWVRRTPRVLGGSDLRARSNQTHNRAYIWVYDPSVTERIEPLPSRAMLHDGEPLPKRGADEPVAPLSPVYVESSLALFDPIDGAAVEINDLDDGEYDVEIWDTWDRAPPVRRTLTVQRGIGRCPLPLLTHDLALKVKPHTPQKDTSS